MALHILILGGTAWLGREIAHQAVAAGHRVTCAARGRSGSVPDGARLVAIDRDAPPGAPPGPDPLAGLAGQAWDLVIDLTRQPGQARRAMAGLGQRARHWVLVSSISVYADTATPGQDEAAPTVAAFEGDEAGPRDYAAAKRACERACELACERSVPDAATAGAAGGAAPRLLVARVGLIGGPGDPTGRSLYWPHRMARPSTPDGRVLVPDEPTLATQMIDVRDLAAWLLQAGAAQVEGIFNVCGERLPLAEHLRIAAAVGHAAALPGAPAPRPVAVGAGWLAEHGVNPWAGPKSLPLWVPRPSHEGFGAHSHQRAKAAGLTLRPLADTLADALAASLASGRTPWPQAGLSPEDERALLAARSDMPAPWPAR